ncbi:uncharacterized protein LOC124989588 isoform X2 [Sciurus carolinensis]|uniref:uncharacterized protein LOC124989588 isoform X2 n=1 Tax=Sciurus carolinensis TaxID=30640 RepID=UPI001FB50E9C|nr:uncharacterized protein LOC124989588 isoform X2 [Sciurus carolinensis]
MHICQVRGAPGPPWRPSWPPPGHSASCPAGGEPHSAAAARLPLALRQKLAFLGRSGRSAGWAAPPQRLPPPALPGVPGTCFSCSAPTTVLPPCAAPAAAAEAAGRGRRWSVSPLGSGHLADAAHTLWVGVEQTVPRTRHDGVAHSGLSGEASPTVPPTQSFTLVQVSPVRTRGRRTKARHKSPGPWPTTPTARAQAGRGPVVTAGAWRAQGWQQSRRCWESGPSVTRVGREVQEAEAGHREDLHSRSLDHTHQPPRAPASHHYAFGCTLAGLLAPQEARAALCRKRSMRCLSLGLLREGRTPSFRWPPPVGGVEPALTSARVTPGPPRGCLWPASSLPVPSGESRSGLQRPAEQASLVLALGCAAAVHRCGRETEWGTLRAQLSTHTQSRVLAAVAACLRGSAQSQVLGEPPQTRGTGPLYAPTPTACHSGGQEASAFLEGLVSQRSLEELPKGLVSQHSLEELPRLLLNDFLPTNQCETPLKPGTSDLFQV